jgi:hypothetical protein
VALLLALLVLRGHKADLAESGGELHPAAARFDFLGLLLAMAGFTIAVYGITQAGPHGWNTTPFDHFSLGGLSIDMSVVSYLALGGILLLAFVVTELIVKDPVMDVRLFLNYTFASANVLTWAVSGLLFGGLFLMPIFFEQVQGKSPLDTGVALISQGLAAAVATILTSRLYNRIGPRWLIAIGFVFITAGTYGFTQLSVDSSILSLQGWMVLRGLGLGFTNIPLQTLTLSGISNRAMARASSLANVTRQIFGAVGISALTSYLIQQTSGYFAGSTAASPIRAHLPPGSDAICLSTEAVAKIPGLAQICNPLVTTAINDTFWVATIGTAICIALALLVGRDPSLVAARQARKRGEAAPVEQQPVLVGE